MSKEATANALDTKVESLMQVIKERTAAIKATESHNWVTNCSFPRIGSSDRINIKTVASVDTLVELIADLLLKQEAMVSASKLLDVATPVDLKHGNYTTDQWISDFKARIAKIQIETKKAELAKLKSMLDGLVSPEQRRALEIAAIEEMLSEGNV